MYTTCRVGVLSSEISKHSKISPPPSLRSHLTSSPMGVFSGDYGTIACCVPELRTIELCPFPIENELLPPPSTFSMGNRPNSLAHNSRTQQAIVIILEISSKFIIQFILGENPGNPTLLINQ